MYHIKKITLLNLPNVKQVPSCIAALILYFKELIIKLLHLVI